MTNFPQHFTLEYANDDEDGIKVTVRFEDAEGKRAHRVSLAKEQGDKSPLVVITALWTLLEMEVEPRVKDDVAA